MQALAQGLGQEHDGEPSGIAVSIQAASEEAAVFSYLSTRWTSRASVWARSSELKMLRVSGRHQGPPAFGDSLVVALLQLLLVLSHDLGLQLVRHFFVVVKLLAVPAAARRNRTQLA